MRRQRRLHETECVTYHGPDAAYAGRELCFSSNTDTLTIVDVTNKGAPVQLSRTGYAGRGYTHQAWLTEDHHHLLLDDETDETAFGHNSRTYIWDVSDVKAPVIGSMTGRWRRSAQPLHPRRPRVRSQLPQRPARARPRRHRQRPPAGGRLLRHLPGQRQRRLRQRLVDLSFFPSGAVLVSGIDGSLFVLRPAINAAGLADTPTSTPIPTFTPTRTRTPTRTATPPVGTPVITAPTAGLVATVSGVTFAWTAVAAATRYDVRITTAGNATVFSGSLTGNAATSTLIQPAAERQLHGDGAGLQRRRLRPVRQPRLLGGLGGADDGADDRRPDQQRGADLEPAEASWTAVSGGGGFPIYCEVRLSNLTTGGIDLQITQPDPMSTVTSRGARLSARGARLPGRLRPVEHAGGLQRRDQPGAQRR
ncbi:MAG: choice-of-anchor B family protein [Candidatus Binatia bacterium]